MTQASRAFARRIIPAYAGSTNPPTLTHSRRRDHPRIRGEHASWRPSTPAPLGSSPHTRGAPPGHAHRDSAGRIIPAYAGSTDRVIQLVDSGGDHPRIRGEHVDRVLVGIVEYGSSPHTRGARRPGRRRARGAWIIPAYAGSTSPATPGRRRPGDHPRIRGEHAAVLLASSVWAGSSPHTRGALAALASQAHSIGIIPAYAGSTRLCDADRRRFADHPRIRGEHQVLTVPGDALEGSSPHTRGAPNRR